MNDQANFKRGKKINLTISKTAVKLVRIIGSWSSVLFHTLIFSSWFIFNFDLETLLVIVSIEAIYIGIFILMAENIETAQRDHLQELKRRRDMALVKKDADVDEKSLQEIERLHLKIDLLQKKLIRKK